MLSFERRLFLSIPFPKSWVDLFDDYKKDYLDQPIRWIEKENLHLTLYFIGETPETEMTAIKEKLKQISSLSSSGPFTIAFSKIDFAPPGKSKRMIWAYFLPSEDYTRLVYQIQNAIGGKKGGERKEEREPPERSLMLPVVPHATLARFRDFKPLRHLKLRELQMPSPILSVVEFELQESRLSPSGAQYTVVESFLLKGSL
jgi:2'-5' RNA ligase